jgi:hypothetical protein
MIWLTVLKYVCLIFAIVYTFSNVGKVFTKEYVPARNIVVMAVNIAAVIALHFEAGV